MICDERERERERERGLEVGFDVVSDACDIPGAHDGKDMGS